MTLVDKGVNPFQPAPGANPPVLAGRSAELASIADACGRAAHASAPVPIVFIGLRGMGKTVLLNEVRRETKGAIHLQLEIEHGVPLTLSLRRVVQAIQPTLDSFTKRSGKAFANLLQYLPLPGVEVPHVGEFKLIAPDAESVDHLANLGIAQTIQTLNDAVVAIGKYLVITVDEVQDVDIAGYRSLVSAVHQSAGTRSPILLASAGLPQTTHILRELRTYARRWDRFELGFLTRAESAEAIRTPIAHAGLSIDGDALDRLVDESAGYPFFLQRYASSAWNKHRGNVITLADVDAIIPNVRAMIDKLFYADDFSGVSPRERLFCKILADLGPGPQALGRVSAELGVASADISSIRARLIRKGLIYAPATGAIAFRIPFADRYVREHQEFFNDADAQAYRKELATRDSSSSTN